MRRLRCENSEALPKRAAPFACRLVIMAKVPIAGRVKTRLAREVGVVSATMFYRHAMREVVARLSGQPFWRTIVIVDPDSGVASRMLPGGPVRAGQGRGDIGVRMQRPMRTMPPGPVCLVGTDVPDVTVADVRRAFWLLGRHDAVFGPAEDGGFWLVGLKRRPRVIDPYRGQVPWSGPDTLERTLAVLTGFQVGSTTRHHDVDSAADLAHNDGRYARRVRPVDTRIVR
jgi:rSAM/selenodomain-associated transferase 1